MSVNKRVVLFAQLILDNKTTIREVAKMTGYSKSTVHKDLNDRLLYVDENLFEEVKKLLTYNKKIRHIRGGMSTKCKYINMEYN